jgi:hypothetical protein
MDDNEKAVNKLTSFLDQYVAKSVDELDKGMKAFDKGKRDKGNAVVEMNALIEMLKKIPGPNLKYKLKTIIEVYYEEMDQETAFGILFAVCANACALRKKIPDEMAEILQT